MDWINKIYVWFNYRWTVCLIRKKKKKYKNLHVNISSPFVLCVWRRAHKMCVCMDVFGVSLWKFRNRKIQSKQRQTKQQQKTKQFNHIDTNCVYEHLNTLSARLSYCVWVFFRVLFRTKCENVCTWLAAILVWTTKKTQHQSASQNRYNQQQHNQIPNLPHTLRFWRTLLFPLRL